MIENNPITPYFDDTFLRALRREMVAYTPVWLMRQAGRYLPEYLKTRARAGSFMELAKNPDLATEVTLQPLERFGLDAAILFSDILTVPDAMGLEVRFAAGEGPRLVHPLHDEKAVADLDVPDMGNLEYVFAAVRQIRKALSGMKRPVPLIGFSGSPWTLACYMVEGGGSKEYARIKTMLYARPDLLERVLTVNVQAVAAYLNAQIEAGAQAVMIFDSWGGVLADGAYQRYSLTPTQKVIAGLTREHEGRNVPVVLFTKGGGLWLEEIAASGADAVGVDWTVDLQIARARVGAQVALQGNLDPAVLFAPEPVIRAQVRQALDSFGELHGQGYGHVFNLGHGISQHTPVDAVAALVDEVHVYSRQLHYPG